MKPLVLASQSSYRAELLTRLGVHFESIAHRCDERSLPVASCLKEHAIQLATMKGESLVEPYPGRIIIGSDQIAELNGEILHKPGSKKNAIAQLQKMQGQTHRLHTAVALCQESLPPQIALESHTLTMRPLTQGEIQRYVERENPMDCCGSYKIEGLGISLFKEIQGGDFNAITGLPLMSLSTLLRDAGYSIP